MAIPIPSRSFMDRMRAAIRVSESRPASRAAPTRTEYPVDHPSFFVEVVECDDDSGFAEVKAVDSLSFHENGYLQGTVIDGAPSLFALNGPLNWYEADDIALCLPCRGKMSDGTLFTYVLLPLHQGLNFNASPTEDSATLAAEQDDPGEHARCGDTVEP